MRIEDRAQKGEKPVIMCAQSAYRIKTKSTLQTKEKQAKSSQKRVAQRDVKNNHIEGACLHRPKHAAMHNGVEENGVGYNGTGVHCDLEVRGEKEEKREGDDNGGASGIRTAEVKNDSKSKGTISKTKRRVQAGTGARSPYDLAHALQARSADEREKRWKPRSKEREKAFTCMSAVISTNELGESKHGYQGGRKNRTG